MRRYSRRARLALAPGLLLLGVVALGLVAAPPARALDTYEVYPPGLHAAEAYLVRVGQGADTPDLRGLLAITGVAMGLTGRSHCYLFTGLYSDDRYEGGVDQLTLGYFQTLIDQTSFDLDGWAELGARGEGLGEVRRGLGWELNYEGPRGGLYWRGTAHWERDPDAEDEAGRRERLSYGLYLRAGPVAQLFAEWRQERLRGFAAQADAGSQESWALGFNRELSKTTELILEGRAVEPPAGSDLDRSWDLTLGWVVIW